jgi:hypothetical protein
MGERRVGFPTLYACGVVKKCHGMYFIQIHGAGRLYPAPLPNNLFSIEDGLLHYDVQVERNQPDIDMPEEDDEVEGQGEGPEQEAQPQNPYATYDNIYALKGTIGNNHNFSINIRGTS